MKPTPKNVEKAMAAVKDLEYGDGKLNIIATIEKDSFLHKALGVCGRFPMSYVKYDLIRKWMGEKPLREFSCEEFAKVTGFSKHLIKKIAEEIPGAYKSGGSWRIPPGAEELPIVRDRPQKGRKKEGKEPEYGWYGAGYACCKAKKSGTYPKFDDQKSWNEYLNGFSQAYEEMNGSDNGLELWLEDGLEKHIFDKIKNMKIFEKWDSKRANSSIGE